MSSESSGPAKNLRSCTIYPAPPGQGGDTSPDAASPPTISSPADSGFDPIVVGRCTTPMALATIAPLAASPSSNRFADLSGTDDDSAPADDTNDGHGPTTGMPREDGGSQPLLDDDINAGVGTLAAAPRLTLDDAMTQIHRLLEAHDHVLTSAIADITNIATPPPPPWLRLRFLTSWL